MKKILISTILVLAIVINSCAPKKMMTSARAFDTSPLDSINVGAYNNDPSADKLRTSFIKANQPINLANYLELYTFSPAEFAILRGGLITTAELNRLSGVTSNVQTQLNARIETADSTGNAAGNYVTRKALRDTIASGDYATKQNINDTMSTYLATATVGVAAADSNIYAGYTTRTYVESLLGSGSGLSAQRLAFIIGVTTGAPSAADSIVVHSSFEGKHIDVYRNTNTITGGAKQFQQFTATNIYDGFRVKHDTITVNPVWVAGEQVMIDIIEPILWSYLSLEGEESALLDSLNGYWKFDEASGTAVVDATGTQNGTTNATAGVAGKLGLARDFDAANDVVNIAYNANTVPSGADFSVAMWFKMDSLPSVMAQSNYLFQQNRGSSPYSAHYLYINSADDKLKGVTRNTDGTSYEVLSSGALSVDTWYHVVFVNRGDGQTLQMYLNGTDVSASAGTFSGTLMESASTTCFGNSYSGAGSYFEGIIDSPGIWNRALTSGEVTTLYNSGNGNTHPFN